MFHIIKKADIVLFFILVILGLFLSWYAFAGSAPGKTVVVRAGGKLFGTYDLAKDQEVTIDQNGHVNQFIIKDGTVQMIHSDCKNQVCVDTGAISRSAQTIVCLPNRVIIEIKGEEDEYDTISN